MARLLAGPRDQRTVDSRKDVLVYTGAPLDRDLEVTGHVRAVLFVSSSAPQADFTARLVDVHPDGKAISLCDGILRGRYRESLEKPSPLEPGRIYRLEIDLGATSNVFFKGHRLRLQIAGSNYPRFDVSPAPAAIRLFHDRGRPSSLILPVAAR
jgi:putative CocE/NonD family hydrolase